MLDPSIVLAWLFDDEHEPLADRAIEGLPDGMTWVPQLWHFEVRNGLLMGERRGRISRERCDSCIHSLETVHVNTDDEPNLATTLSLARVHGLTFYDSLYLELARRRSAGIATLDQCCSGRREQRESQAPSYDIGRWGRLFQGPPPSRPTGVTCPRALGGWAPKTPYIEGW